MGNKSNTEPGEVVGGAIVVLLFLLGLCYLFRIAWNFVVKLKRRMDERIPRIKRSLGGHFVAVIGRLEEVAGAVLTFAPRWRLIGIDPYYAEEWRRRLGELSLRIGRSLVGQHIAAIEILDGLRRHFVDGAISGRPLIFIFSGPPGNGKTHLATNILAPEFRRWFGEESVGNFLGVGHMDGIHSPADMNDWIAANMRSLARRKSPSLFIFDEINQVRELNTLTNEIIGNQIYHKSVFIFLTNAGQQKIIDETQRHRDRRENNYREHLRWGQFQDHLNAAVIEAEGALRGAILIDDHHVHRIIPFLPLEPIHIFQGIQIRLLENPEYREHIHRVIPQRIAQRLQREFQPELQPAADDRRIVFVDSGAMRALDRYIREEIQAVQ